MSENSHKKSERIDRVYTQKDIDHLLNTSRDAYRLQRLNIMRRIFVSVAFFYITVIIAAVLIYVFNAHGHSSKDDAIATSIDYIMEPASPRVRIEVNPATNEARTIYDTTDFSASTDELILIKRIEDVDVSLFDIKIPKDIIDACFSEHRKRFLNHDERADDIVLRFRVVLKDKRSLEAMVSLWGSHIGTTRSSLGMKLPINEIECFRGALCGSTYKDDVETNLKRRGLKMLPKGLVADSEYECMSDAEAKRLFHVIASLAEDTRFDWGAVLRVLTFGVWNPHHPWLSFFVTIALALIVLIVNKKVFAK